MGQAEINKWLDRRYGRSPHNTPWFRIVFSEKETEFRGGEHNVFHGPLFLRTEVGVKRVPKYMYLKDQWVLEKWYYHDPRILVTELVFDGVRATYEAIYAFPNKDGHPLQPSYLALEFAISKLLNLNPKKASDYNEEERQQIQAEFEVDRGKIEDGQPWLAHQLHNRSAIIHPGLPGSF